MLSVLPLRWAGKGVSDLSVQESVFTFPYERDIYQGVGRSYIMSSDKAEWLDEFIPTYD